MNRKLRVSAWGLSLLVLVSMARAGEVRDFVAGEVLVRYQAAGPLSAAGAAPTQRDSAVTRLRVPRGMSVRGLLAALRHDPRIAFAEPNYIIRKAAVPDDPLYVQGLQWPLAAVDAEPAWNLATGGPVTVAVVDTGIDYSHPDLAGNIWGNPGEVAGDGVDNDGNGVVDDVHGACFDAAPETDPGCPEEVTGDPMEDDTAEAHGTHVAGIVGAVTDNGVGIAGTAWAVELMAVKVMHGPLGIGTVSDAAAGIHYAVDNGADIINLSFTVPGRNRALASALDYAAEHDVLVVSAAGNAGRSLDIEPVSPAILAPGNNVAVAATTPAGGLARYSNLGPATVAVAAPGGDDSDGVLSTVSPITGGGEYAYLHGTSMAAPRVAGTAALLRVHRPDLDAGQLKARLINGAQVGILPTVISSGALSAYGALTVGDLPAIFDVEPRQATAGDLITISGANFGDGPYNVALGGEPLTVEQALSDSKRLHAVLPECEGDGLLQVGGAGGRYPISVSARPHELKLTAQPTSGELPLEVTFRAGVAPALPEPVVAAWDFGGGEFGVYEPFNGDPVSRVFVRDGRRTVRVSLRDACGRVHQASTAIDIEGSNDRPCLVSSAFAGDDHPVLNGLRRIRDDVLARAYVGRRLIDGYYRLSAWLMEKD
ncbi:S8 family serine peptidase [Ectothiorhodospiraceae bacterium WFHF3C12]|nr:S8 family serine peptidase [Ectothiorhodospiraceae bacterium WFHF3C12]